jgi:hypothetical protein
MVLRAGSSESVSGEGYPSSTRCRAVNGTRWEGDDRSPTLGNANRSRRLPSGSGEDVVHVALPSEGASGASCWPPSPIPVGRRGGVARVSCGQRMIVEHTGVVDHDALEHPVELLGVDPVGPLDLAVQPRGSAGRRAAGSCPDVSGSARSPRERSAPRDSASGTSRSCVATKW